MAAYDEAQTLDKVMQLLEREPSSTLSNGLLFQLAATDIPALREQLPILVSTGKSKEAIGGPLKQKQVEHFTEKEVKKHYKKSRC